MTVSQNTLLRKQRLEWGITSYDEKMEIDESNSKKNRDDHYSNSTYYIDYNNDHHISTAERYDANRHRLSVR